jgi:pimeloyl-ACP methyl ester carboxylesterase
MPQVVILHGYSDNYLSFQPLQNFLVKAGFDVADIALADYISLEDHVTIEDLAKAFTTALANNGIATTEKNFDLIVHSTGGLVAREWLSRFFLRRNLPCPLKHFLMLAPANFGSPLAHLGKSMFGRIIKGWKSDFQTGTHILDALEMASAYSWQLAYHDLFAERSFYQPESCLTAVFVGSQPYKGGFRELVNKDGTDGTVYVATANLNASSLRIHFRADGAPPTVEIRKAAYAPIGFRVFNDRDHASITRPDQGPASLGQDIVDFLRSSPADFPKFKNYYDQETAKTFTNPTLDIFHSYQNVVTRVTDDLGMPIKDYYAEFFEANTTQGTEPDPLMLKIHTGIIEDVHNYKADTSYRSFIFDITDLDKVLSQNHHTLAFSLSAAGPSGKISYAGSTLKNMGELELPAGSQQLQVFRRPNETLLIDIVLDRIQSPEVFSLYDTKHPPRS